MGNHTKKLAQRAVETSLAVVKDSYGTQTHLPKGMLWALENHDISLQPLEVQKYRIKGKSMGN